MSRITGYKLIQADGNRELAEEVQRFIDKGEGWEPFGSAQIGVASGEQEALRCYIQAIVRRESESAELKRLRDFERHCSGIVDELDNPCTNELGMLTFAHEELEKNLRGGPYERKP